MVDLLRRGRARFLATVVFTDIAGSTEVAAQLGDRAWRDRLERHHRRVRALLRRHRGREIDTAGDGFFTAFDTPADAVAFALELARPDDSGLTVRSGLHMGEVERIGGKVGGIAVHIGSRVAALAGPGEVLVSATVKDLATGSGVVFEPRGESVLKGVPGQWALWAATRIERPAQLPAPPRRPLRERAAGVLPTSLPRSVQGRVALAFVLLGLVGLAAGAAVLLSVPRTLPGVEADSVGRIDPGAGGVVAAISVGGLPDRIASGEGALWITDPATDSVVRVDPLTSRVIQAIAVGDDPVGVAVGHGAVWVANSGSGTVSRVDPGTNEELETIPVGNGPYSIATDDRWVWVTNRLDGTLARIDPTTGDVTASTVGATPIAVAAGSSALWVSDFDAGAVLRVDPATGARVAVIHVGNGPTAITAAPSGIWVVNSRDGTVSRIDPSSNAVSALVDVGGEPSGIAATTDLVWVGRPEASEVVAIAASTGVVARRIAVASAPQAIVSADGQVWFTTRASQASHRGGTLRIVGDAESGLFPGSLDPAGGGDYATGQLLLVTNDGLVAFKRTTGIDGYTLVPDLAAAIPTPTDDGRVYTFQLREGITYSDGRQVTASDVVHSLERAAVLSDVAGFILSGIPGAAECFGEPTACDLSTSIVADDAGGTVTIRLDAADPEFLFKLAQPPAFVVPADTPMRVVDVPLPATGPYVIDSFVAGESVHLVRNPRFVVLSAGAQPDGYPDEIEWRALPAAADAITGVTSGSADVVTLPLEFPGGEVDRLRTRFASQLHVATTLIAWFEFMNTALAPFDRPEVRRAVSLAADRDAIVEAWGGPLKGRISCQYLPPAFPGYEPYCPHTLSPGPGGAWRAPDVATARSLIDSSGTRGMKVQVWGADAPGHADVARNFASLLDELGFDASANLVDYETLFDLPAREKDAQMTGWYWIPASPAPSDFLVPLFTCPGFTDLAFNAARFCDPAVDARAKAALALESSDPAAAYRIWAEVDRALVDQAPAVGSFDLTQLGLVSKRVGNVLYHPLWGLLLDQLWVQ